MIIVYLVLVVLVILCVLMAVNTIRKKPEAIKVSNPEPILLDKDTLAKNLSGMIKIPAIAADKIESFDRDTFLMMHKYLEDTYPLIHKTLEKEIINEYGLLYKWTGTGSDKKPFLMMAHMDVVPADERTLRKWKYPPFSGEIAEGYVWGRGAIDMKGQLAAEMESIEYLLSQGYKPKRDIYIALGFDEERMGRLGAKNMVEVLKQRGINFDFVIDEGGVIADGKEFGIDGKLALICISEKGYADIKLTAESAGGHASRPPKQTAAGALSEAIVKLEKHHMKSTLNKPMRSMMNSVCGYMKFPGNVAASNLFITKPLMLKSLSSTPNGNAMIHTTVAPTMLMGSTATNVLAERAEAVINCRISPDDSIDGLIKYIKKIVGTGIKVEIINAHEPSSVSSTESDAYKNIEETIRETFPDYIISPFLMVAATDSRWYAQISDGVYLFEPFRSMCEDINTMHAAGERLKIDSLYEGTGFFIRLVKKADR